MPYKEPESGTKEYWKKKYDDLREFVDGIEDYTENFDSLCECSCHKGCHSKDCYTVLLRLDLGRLRS